MTDLNREELICLRLFEICLCLLALKIEIANLLRDSYLGFCCLCFDLGLFPIHMGELRSKEQRRNEDISLDHYRNSFDLFHNIVRTSPGHGLFLFPHEGILRMDQKDDDS